MIDAVYQAPNFGDILLRRITAVLKTALHLGVHRCATTSFQAYLDQNTQVLAQFGVAAWTPRRTRKALFAGLVRPPEAACQADRAKDDAARILVERERDALAQQGIRNLVVSEENMIGTPRDNLARGALYPHLPQRLARFVNAFGGKIDDIGLCIRNYEDYWASVLAFSTAHGGDVPSPSEAAQLARQPRNWTTLVQDITQAVPNARITVWTFEAFAGRPRRQFNMLTGRIDVAHLLDQSPNWKNSSRNCNKLRHILKTKGRAEMAARLPRGGGTWMPFDTGDRAHMQARYDADKRWLSHAGPQITFHAQTAIKVPRKIHALTGADQTGGHHEPTRLMG